MKEGTSLRLQDKVVLITDAASPLGREIAARIIAEGAIPAANVYPPEAEAPGGCGFLTHANPRSKQEIEDAVTATLDKYGRIDVVVHTNNEVIPVSLEECTDEEYDRALDVNVKSAFLYTQAIGPLMKEAKKGNFIFVSSIHDEKPFGGAFAYSLAKGSLKMLVKEMVLDLGPFNVRTNLIELGPVEGDERRFYSDLSPLYEHTRERVVNQAFVSLAETANAVVFLADDGCPSANGTELRLDGGFLFTYFFY